MVNIHQIYFDDHTKNHCDTAWNWVDNSENLNEFFENQVISDLIEQNEHRKEEYFGVFSHDVNGSVNFKEDGLRFTPINLERIISKYKVDVFSFQKRRQQENIVTQSENYHPGYLNIMNQVLDHCGYTLPHRLDKIILFNLMVCTGDFWQAYYDDMLKPAMEILKEIPEAYEDSKYHLIGKPMDPIKSRRFVKAFGKDYYPFHPFICERLASVYLQHNKQWTFKHIF